MKTIYEYRKGVTKELEGSTHTLPILFEYAWSMLRVCLEYAYSMPTVCLAYVYTHLIWEPAISVRARRTASPLPTDQESAPYGLFLTLLLLLLALGSASVWGQTDYSGTYYIASCGKGENNGTTVTYTYDPDHPENNFYLCPTKGWIYYQSSSPYWNNNTPGQPFLTTFKCRSGATDPTTNNPYNEREAKWTLIKHSEQDNYYYYIRRNIDGKYLTLNEQLGNNATANRLRLHIEATSNPGNNHLFAVETQGTNLVISPINATAENKRWYLNVHQGNFNSLTGQQATAKNEGPTNYKNIGGTIGIYSEKSDQNAPWLLEDIIQSPLITQQNNNTIAITYPGTEPVTLYYTTDGSKPDPTKVGESDPTKIYTPGTTTISMINPVTTVKAIAVKTKDTDETLDTYSRVVSLTTQWYIGSSNYYLFQNVECTDYYMIPGDVSSNNTTVNTSSLFRPSMSWYFLNAGSEDGVLYYYIINRHTGDYLYRTGNSVYMKASSAFDNTDNGYKFSIKQGYDTNNDPVAGFNIIPKGAADNTCCIFKGGYNNPTLANAKEDVVKYDKNARNKNYGQWNIISAPDNKLPASLTYDSSNPADANWPTFLSSSSKTKYFKIENVGAEGFYMNPPENLSTGFVAATGTSTGGNELAWCVVEAGHDDWQKYYYIIHASTGKYMYFTKTIPDNPMEMTGQSNVIALRDYDNTNTNLYQFVFAKSTVDGAYYIVPKGLTGATYNEYYALYRDANNPLKSTSNRLSDNYKWKFVSATLFCNAPEFVEEDGKIRIKCNTNAAKIYINTENNDDPTSASTLYDPSTNENQNWATTSQVRIKARAVVSDGASPTPNTASSAVVTLLNKPDVTLTTSSYEYDGTAKTFEKSNIAEVSITANEVKTTADASTYDIDTFENNITAGTPSSATPPTVKLKDVAGDNWFIWNASKSFTITPKALTITADSESKDYDGTELTKNSYTNTDLADGDAITSVTVTGSQIVVGTSANVPSGAFIKKGEEDRTACYEITYTNGTLEVTKKAVTITADSDTKVYDGTALTKNTYTNTDLADGDAITSVTVTGSQTVVGSSANVPSAAVIKKGEEDRTACYEITYTNGTLEVTKKAVTITADSDTKVYDGTALTKNSYTNTALAEGDAIESVTVTGSQTDVGSSANVPSAAVIKKDTEDRTSCYEITYTNGTLTVTGIGVIVTADNKTKEYSKDPTTDPTLTATVTGLVGTDVITYTISRAAGEDVNDYVITPTGESEQGNYTVTYVPGTFTITPATLTITPNDGQTKEYGDADPAFTFTPTGLKGTDAIDDVVQGALARTEGESRGTYAFNQGTLAIATGNNNYTLAYANPNNYVFTISQKPLTSTDITINIDESTNPITVVVMHAKSDGDYILSQKESETDPEYDYSLATVGEGDPGYNPNYFKTRITGNGNYSGYVDIRQAIVHFTTDANQAEWSATFVAEKAGTTDIGHVLPEGIAAYIISGIEGSWAIPEPMDYIPAGVPVLLVAHEEKTGFLVRDAKSADVSDISAQKSYNKLKEVTAESAHFNTRQIYVLYKNEFVLNKEGDLAKGKVYMENPNYVAPSPSSPAPANLSIAWGNLTGIEDGRWKMDDGNNEHWYTLDGRCLIGKPTAKGLYIVNGKKRVVK